LLIEETAYGLESADRLLRGRKLRDQLLPALGDQVILLLNLVTDVVDGGLQAVCNAFQSARCRVQQTSKIDAETRGNSARHCHSGYGLRADLRLVELDAHLQIGGVGVGRIPAEELARSGGRLDTSIDDEVSNYIRAVRRLSSGQTKGAQCRPTANLNLGRRTKRGRRHSQLISIQADSNLPPGGSANRVDF